MQNTGVDDWLAFYDPTHQVDEHDPEKATRDERGARSDVHEEACAELKRFGWSDEEIRTLEQYTEPETFARVVDDEHKRAQQAAAG